MVILRVIGIGSQRIEIAEEHKIFSASTVFFRAEASPSSRRTASIGPGLVSHNDEEELDQYIDDDPTPRNGRVDPSDHSEVVTSPQALFNARPRRVSADYSHFQRNYFSHDESYLLPQTPPYTPATSSRASAFNQPSFNNTSSGNTSDGDESEETYALEAFRNTSHSGLESRRSSETI